jgi:hypothetical protein
MPVTTYKCLDSRGSLNKICLISMDNILTTYYIYHPQDKTLGTADVTTRKIQGCRIAPPPPLLLLLWGNLPRLIVLTPL